MGYLVHCLSDRLVLPMYFHHTFPFIMLKGRITKTTGPILLEFLNIELLRKKSVSIYGTNNSVLCELGIEDETVKKFIQQIGDYINSPTIQSSLSLYKNLGTAKASRTAKYEKYISLLSKIRFLKYVIHVRFSVEKVNREIAAELRSQVSEFIIKK